jgi:heptosyltransferase II
MKVLLIRFSALGDVVLATAAVEALAEDAPDAAVHVLTKPEFSDVFRHHPGVAHIVDWTPAENLWSLGARLRQERYDLVVDLHVNIRTGVLRPLVPRAHWTRVAKHTHLRRAALRLHRPVLLPRDHVIDRYVRALGAAGVRPIRRRPRLYVTAAHRHRLQGLLADAGWDGAPLLGLAPAARRAGKAWPREHWRSLLRLAAAGGGTFPLLIGGPGDRGLCEHVLGSERGLVLAGRASVLDTAAALEHASVLVTNDSAPLHIAQAVGTPVAALFGPTVPAFGFFPIGPRDMVLERSVPCRPCSLHGPRTCPRRHHRCLADIEPGAVFEAVRRMLALPAEPALPAGGPHVRSSGRAE